MKKTFSKLFLSMGAVVALLFAAGCSSNLPTDKEVADKLSTDQQLTEADYTTMIDYCGKYAEEAQKYYDIINAQPNDSTAEYTKAADDLANLYGNYTYLESFRNALNNADMSKIGKDNEKKVNDFSKYQAFPLPAGAGQNLENPSVVGVIEDMPSQGVTDSTGVISTGDGEAVQVNVK